MRREGDTVPGWEWWFWRGVDYSYQDTFIEEPEEPWRDELWEDPVEDDLWDPEEGWYPDED